MQVQPKLTGDYEQCLARAVLADDDRAIEEFKALLRAPINRLVRLHPGPRRTAHEYADGVNDAIVYLIVGMRQNRKGVSSPRFSPLQKWLADPRKSLIGFCLVSARNYLYDLAKLRGIPTDPLPEKESPAPPRHPNPFLPTPQEEELFDKERKRAVQDIYERLPPHDRRIIMLKYYFDMTDAEIGKKIGISETVSRERRKRALEKFERLFLSKYAHLVSSES